MITERNNDGPALDDTPRPAAEEGAAEVIFALLAAWRVEVCLIAPPVVLGVWSYLHFGPLLPG